MGVPILASELLRALPMARVLVIDDSPLARSSLRYALEDAEFEVTDAPDGASALSAIEAAHPDVVVCDIDMPGMSGIEVMRELHVRLPLTPVLMHTAHGDAELVVNAMREGAFGYLLKGLEEKVLVQEIHAAVRHRRVLEHNQKLADDNRVYQQNLERLAEERAAQIIQLQAQKAHAEKLAALGHRRRRRRPRGEQPARGDQERAALARAADCSRRCGCSSAPSSRRSSIAPSCSR